MKTKSRMKPEPKTTASADTVKVLTATDIHLKRSLYCELRAAVEKHRPAVVCLAGDFLDAEDLPPSNARLTPTAAALALAALPCEVVFSRGNHLYPPLFFCICTSLLSLIFGAANALHFLKDYAKN